MTMTPDERHTITGALRVAAAVYDQDAATCRAWADHQRIAEQFDQQAAEARALADRIEARS